MSAVVDHDRDRARREDELARRVAVEVWDRPLLLEAGAGSGKTAVLIARLVVWLLGPGWERARQELIGAEDDQIALRCLDGVVAITFTEAAAAEMAHRARTALDEVKAGRVSLLPGMPAAVPPDAAGRAGALLAHLDRLLVTTIHAFARRLLVEFPLEAGTHPVTTIDASGADWQALVEAAVFEEWPAAWRRGDEDVKRLAAAGCGPFELARAVLSLAQDAVGSDTVERIAAETPGSLVDDVVAAARELVDLTRPVLVLAPRGRVRGAGDLLFALAEIGAAVPRSSPGPLEVMRESVERAATQSMRRRLRDWSRLRFTESEREAFATIAPQLARLAGRLVHQLDQLDRSDPAQFVATARLTAHILRRAEAAAERRGLLRFADLVPKALELLRRNASVVAALRHRFDQLLVDEVQDTDALQVELIWTLALQGPMQQRPGLFLVGDPKQSIYGWRSADLFAYDELGRRVEQAGGEILRLVVNFRSVPAVLAAVERLVGPRMVRQAGVQPRFEPLVPHRVAGEGVLPPRQSVERWRVESQRERLGSAAATRIEAAGIAAEIVALIGHGTDPERIAVLLRTTTDLPIYLEQLRSHDVAYAVARERDWRRRREVVEASALLRLLLDPADDVALAAVLRSPLVGVPDFALEPLWLRGLPGLMAGVASAEEVEIARQISALTAGIMVPAGLERDPAPDWRFALEELGRVVARLRRCLASEPSDGWVELVRQAMQLETLEASRPLGRWRCAVLARFFAALREDLAAGAGPLDVAERLRSWPRGGELEDVGAVEPALEPGAVRVLTIHAAKGLDFDHVFVAQVHKEPAQRSQPRATRRVADAAGGEHLVLLGIPSPGMWRGEEALAAVAAAEQVRLLYVALTRARERLVVVGRAQGQPTDTPRSFADLLATDVVESALDDPLIRIVLVGEPPTTDRRKETVAASSLDHGHLVELRHRLELARERQQRPYLGVASVTGTAGGEPLAGVGAGGGPSAASSMSPELARRVGAAFHKVLEVVDLGTSDRHGLANAVCEVAQRLVRNQGLAVRSALAELIEQFLGGPLLERLERLAPGVLARELPFLAPPEPERGPVGAIAGVIDVLARRGDGSLVVVDYKTDWLEEVELGYRGPGTGDRGDRTGDGGEGTGSGDRAVSYREQGRAYSRAVALALELPTWPSAELWLVRHGEVIVHEWSKGDSLLNEEADHDLSKLRE